MSLLVWVSPVPSAVMVFKSTTELVVDTHERKLPGGFMLTSMHTGLVSYG